MRLLTLSLFGSFALALCSVVGCRDDRAQVVKEKPDPAMADDLTHVDDYLTKWDQFAQGQNSLMPGLKNREPEFKAALTRLLQGKDKRAPARMVFSAVVQVAGSIPVDSELGKAAAPFLGPDFPVTTNKGERLYFASDLYFWWQQHSKEYEPFPVFDEWATREFAQTIAIPMYRKFKEEKQK
jgi:hypothetical protein